MWFIASGRECVDGARVQKSTKFEMNKEQKEMRDDAKRLLNYEDRCFQSVQASPVKLSILKQVIPHH